MKDFFQQARPVWAKERSREMNVSLGFYGSFPAAGEKDQTILKITGASLYRIFLNGTFVGHGPARAAHGYYRVDEIILASSLLREQNHIAVEAAGYNAGSFYLLDQPSFLQAEVSTAGRIVLATGLGEPAAGAGQFTAKVLSERIRKVQRYSFQRVFSEAYRMEAGYDSWRRAGIAQEEKIQLEETREKQLLKRHVHYSRFPVLRPERICGVGCFEQGKAHQIWEDRSYLGISRLYKGFPKEELEVFVSGEMDGCRTISLETLDGAPQTSDTRWDSHTFRGESGQFVIQSMEYNATGFLGAEVECEEDSVLIYAFDEVLNAEGDITYNRMCCVNAVRYELKKGHYTLETIEPYTLKYGKWMVLKGAVIIKDSWIREYTNPDAEMASFTSSDPVLNGIFEAGRRTFAQNAVDLYMDCPSRERAGWLCDSFFMGRVEAVLTGDTKIEDNFLENYALPGDYPYLPKGMLPMCYPSDHNTGEFIPNWALWMILELEEYCERKKGGPAGRQISRQIAEAMREKAEKLFDYFKAFENQDGLLEDLDGWVFVEWSKANDLTAGVNYPSNMLYSMALDIAGRMYGKEEWTEKAEKIKDVIRKQSYQDGFFADHGLRIDGCLCVQKDKTEVCQYYAYFTGIADAEKYPELFDILCTDFGPWRDSSKVYPDVASANAFIGNYLRLEILSRYGRTKQIHKEIRGFFDYMVQRTGTLWENAGAYASCNHGFASHVIYACYRDLLGIAGIDREKKQLTIRFTDLELMECQGSIPIGGSSNQGDIAAWEEEFIHVSRRREENGYELDCRVPEGWNVLTVCPGGRVKYKISPS